VEGRPLFVVVVHLSSKGGDDPLLGLHQPPRRSSEAQRREQAFAVRDLADRLLAADTRFVIEPHTRFQGDVGEQSTMFLFDPSGNALEFKAFADDAQVFAR
jgi:hypothetical protein